MLISNYTRYKIFIYVPLFFELYANVLCSVMTWYEIVDNNRIVSWLNVIRTWPDSGVGLGTWGAGELSSIYTARWSHTLVEAVPAAAPMWEWDNSTVYRWLVMVVIVATIVVVVGYKGHHISQLQHKASIIHVMILSLYLSFVVFTI